MKAKDLKYILKKIVDNSNRPLSDLDKELIKEAINKSQNAPELITSVLTIISSK